MNFDDGVPPDALDLGALELPDLEEASGELHRRIGVALRRIGELRADAALPGERSARWHVASLVVMFELAAASFAVIAATGAAVVLPRLDHHPAAIAATMYAAPTLQALLGRLEQDRRQLAALARSLETHLDERHATAFGELSLRALLAEVAVAEGARCALLVEHAADRATA